MTTRRFKYLGIIAALVAVVWIGIAPRDRSPGDVDLAALSIPELTTEERAGQTLFAANCAACHGANAVGSDQGPPLVHRIYEPSHHGDMAFVLAAKRGVRAHHWRFGNMPAVEDISEEEVLQIASYVRSIQRANGIH